MIDSPSAALLLVAALLLSSLAGVRIAARLPWTDAARTARAPLGFGLALGPFIFGISAVLVLTFLPGWSSALHLAVVFVLLIAAVGLAAMRRRPAVPRPTATPLLWGEWALVISISIAVGALLFLSIFVPLTQNDSLEYMTVGRILFEQRTIGAYPVLDPAANAEGFFGPWTHPPLYVALIYLFEVMQGHADAPGIARLIAPWFALAGAAAVYALARTIGRPVALAAVLIFLTTPLLFLGAVSALMDALPIAGFAMLLLALHGLGAKPLVRGALIGAVAGLALWTHSVTVLFVPLALGGIVFMAGFANWRRWLSEVAALLLFAVLVGGAHYVRNVMLFGTPVSDNPVVFALPGLHWDDYFLINRGLNSLAAIIQYGLLKGWFAVESFGFSYWGMAVGFLFAATVSGYPPLSRILVRGAASFEAWQALLYLVYGVLIVYGVGTAVSIVLGIDLMIKNERYLLSIQAAIAVGAAYGFVSLARWLSGFAKRLAPALLSLALVVLAIGLAGQSAVSSAYVILNRPPALDTKGLEASLSKLGEYQLTDYLRDRTPPDSLVLSMKPADMYYADRRMVGYLDPVLLSFYAMTSPDDASAELASLGIDYIHLPNYGIPTIYNSALTAVLRDPGRADLLVSNAAGQIYALAPSGLIDDAVLDVTPGRWPWYATNVFELGGRKRLQQVGQDAEARPIGQRSVSEPPFGLFHRNFKTIMRTGDGDAAITVRPGSQIAIDLDLTGTGLIAVFVGELSADGIAGRVIPLGTFELSREQPRRLYGRRALLSGEAHRIFVMIEQQGASTLEVNGARIVQLSDAAP